MRESLEQADAAGFSSRKQSKQIQHLAGLEKLISFFPMTNTSDPSLDLSQPAPDEITVDADEEDAEPEAGNDDELAKLDMLSLLEKIRAKYRLTCSVLGVPSQRTASLAELTRGEGPDHAKAVAKDGAGRGQNGRPFPAQVLATFPHFSVYPAPLRRLFNTSPNPLRIILYSDPCLASPDPSRSLHSFVPRIPTSDSCSVSCRFSVPPCHMSTNCDCLICTLGSVMRQSRCSCHRCRCKTSLLPLDRRLLGKLLIEHPADQHPPDFLSARAHRIQPCIAPEPVDVVVAHVAVAAEHLHGVGGDLYAPIARVEDAACAVLFC